MENSTEWFPEYENLLQEWAEKARFYAWMHRKTSADYSRLNNLLSIPMIVISMIDGSANFTMVGMNDSSVLLRVVFPMLVGSLSMLTGILSAISKYLKTAELAEKHELFYRQYNVLVRNISVELSIPANQRKAPSEVVNMNRYELDRLLNESPRIPEHIVRLFNETFPYKRNKPDIANAFSKIIIHGRNANYRKKLDEFVRIRNFYKWKAAKHIININNILGEKCIREEPLSVYHIDPHNKQFDVDDDDDDEFRSNEDDHVIQLKETELKNPIDPTMQWIRTSPNEIIDKSFVLRMSDDDTLNDYLGKNTTSSSNEDQLYHPLPIRKEKPRTDSSQTV